MILNEMLCSGGLLTFYVIFTKLDNKNYTQTSNPFSVYILCLNILKACSVLHI